jgi:hypothetical protein
MFGPSRCSSRKLSYGLPLDTPSPSRVRGCLQPSPRTRRSVLVGLGRAAELRRPQEGAQGHVSAGARTVLRFWDPAQPTRLPADALELAVSESAILEQPGDTGAFQPVAFESRKLTQPERSCSPLLLELLAVAHFLMSFRQCLLDKPFELHTDDANLQWL